jgi:Fe-S cluster assembly protein SufD
MNMVQLTSFDGFAKQLIENGIDDSVIQDAGFNNALFALQKHGLPSPKNEEWKYFPLPTLLKQSYIPASVSKAEFSPSSFQPYIEQAIHVVLVNGFPVNLHELSVIPGLEIISRKKSGDQISDDPVKNPFPHLNRLLSQDEILIRFNTDYSDNRPIHIIHVLHGQEFNPIIISPSITMHIEEGIHAFVIESFHAVKLTDALVNTAVSIQAEKGSEIHHVIIEENLREIVQIYNCKSIVNGNAKVQDHVIIHDSNAVRNTITGSLVDLNATYNIFGIVSANGKSYVDNHTIVDHVAPHCESNEMYKHVLSDSSTAIFNGKIFVRKDAQKTNAYQSNRTLLLSPTSTINTKPQLEIFADDVKCSHGATTGSVDEEALNYLRSRGISREVAMNLLTEAFIGEVIQKIELDSLRSHYEGSALLSNKA